MRTLLPSTLAAIASGSAALVLLVEMQFLTGTLRLATSRMDIVTSIDGYADSYADSYAESGGSGETYIATGLLGAIEEIVDKATEISAQRFTLTGCDPAVMAIAIGEQVRGRPCIIRSAWLDAETHELLEAPIIWTGNLDTVHPVHDPVSKTATVSVVANHRGVLFARAKPIRYTHADQQRVAVASSLSYGPDMSLEYIVSQSNKTVIWPGRGFGAQ